MADWDVTLNAVNYMLTPKSYKSQVRAGAPGLTSGAPAPATVRTARIRLTDFAPGQGHARTRRAAANERGGLLSGLGAFPAPWPMTRDAVASHPARQAILTGFLSTPNRRYPLVVTSSGVTYYFLCLKRSIYRWVRVVGTAPVLRSSAVVADITGACTWNAKIYIAEDATDLQTWTDSAGSLAVLAAGRKAFGPEALITHGGGIWAVDVADKTAVRTYSDGLNTTTQVFQLQGAQINWCSGADALYIATTNGIEKITGMWGVATNTFAASSWGSIAPYNSATDDYSWFLVFAGRLFTWAGSTVIYYDDASDKWRHAGLEGSATFGATVVANILYVSISPLESAAVFQLWAFNGSGWWRIESSATNTFNNPAGDGDNKLVVHQAVSSVNAWAVDWDDRYTAANLLTPFEIITPALDAQLPDRVKTWSRVGVETLRNDGQLVGTWNVAISTSIDAGITWVSAGAAESVIDEVETIDYAVALTANQLMIKVVCTFSAGLPPHIIAIWADATWSETPPAAVNTQAFAERKREWEFQLPARDDIVNRAGAADVRSGQTIRAALWALWAAGLSFTFLDVDATSHSVTMIDCAEQWDYPADQTDQGAQTVLTLTLREV